MIGKQKISFKFFLLLLCIGIGFSHSLVSQLYDDCPACYIYVPQSVTVQIDKAQSIPVIAVECTSAISMSGELPPGLIFNGSEITGIPTSAGTYNVSFSSTGLCDRNNKERDRCFYDCLLRNLSEDCPSLCSCNSCVTTVPVTIYVIDKDVVDGTNPDSPKITASYQRPVSEIIDTTRAKCSKSIPHVNVVKWKSPKTGPTPVAYAVYGDRELTKYFTTITNEGQLRFKFKQRNKSSRRVNRFYIVSIAESGTISRPAVAKIKNRDR